MTKTMRVNSASNKMPSNNFPKIVSKAAIKKKTSKQNSNQDTIQCVNDFVWLYGKVLFEAQSRSGHGDGNGDDIGYLIRKSTISKGNWKATYTLDEHDRSQTIWEPPYHITFKHTDNTNNITRTLFNKLVKEIKVPENILMDDFKTILTFTNNKWKSCVDGSLNQVACIMKPIYLNEKDNNISMQFHLRGCYGFDYWTANDRWNPIKLKRWLGLDKSNHELTRKDYIEYDCELEEYNVVINTISKQQDVDDFIHLYANKLIMAQQLVKPETDTYESSTTITRGNWSVTYQPNNKFGTWRREYCDAYYVTFKYCNLISESVFEGIKKAVKIPEKIFLEDYNELLKITDNKWMYKVNSTFKQVAGIDTYMYNGYNTITMIFNYLEYNTHKWIPVKLNQMFNTIDNPQSQYIDNHQQSHNLSVYNIKVKPAIL